jgi:hypothetical protein
MYLPCEKNLEQLKRELTGKSYYSLNNSNLMQTYITKTQTPPGHLLDTLETTGYSPLTKGRATLVKRTLTKITTLENTFKLIDLNSPLEKSYWKTYHCGNIILQEGEKFYFHKCKQKWCRTCSHIRTADLINGYKHLLESFTEPQMVVLTMKNCKGRELKQTYQNMVNAFKLATRNLTKTHGIKLNGIRTWECTYNIETDEYHPHLNVVVDSREGAELLRAYWMSYWESRVGAKHVNIQAQFITSISTSSDLLEVFKYTTKLAVNHKEETSAQDWIYQCTRGKRLAQAFGTLRRVKISNEATQVDEVKGEVAIEIWNFERRAEHYVNASGETMVSDKEKTDYLNERLRKKYELKKQKTNELIKTPKSINHPDICYN